jgi:hypothetical protein
MYPRRQSLWCNRLEEKKSSRRCRVDLKVDDGGSRCRRNRDVGSLIQIRSKISSKRLIRLSRVASRERNLLPLLSLFHYSPRVKQRMAPAATKRALALSQSSQSPSQGSQARPKKRPRTQAPASQPSTSTQLAPQPAPTTAAVAETGALSAPPAAPAPAASKVSLPPPKKRTLHKGKLRRLSTGHPHGNTNDTSFAALNSNGLSARPRTREKSTLSGAKIGGKSKDLRDRVEAEELWIRRPAKGSTRTKHGLGYAGYLKMGVAAFVERG